MVRVCGTKQKSRTHLAESRAFLFSEIVCSNTLSLFHILKVKRYRLDPNFVVPFGWAHQPAIYTRSLPQKRQWGSASTLEGSPGPRSSFESV